VHEGSGGHQQVETPQDELGHSHIFNGSSDGSEVIPQSVHKTNADYIPEDKTSLR